MVTGAQSGEVLPVLILNWTSNADGPASSVATLAITQMSGH